MTEKKIEAVARAICNALNYYWDGPSSGDREELMRAGRFALKASGPIWQPIATAPKGREIIVYAPKAEGLPSLVCKARFHPDARFIVDGMREPTHWMAFEEPEDAP